MRRFCGGGENFVAALPSPGNSETRRPNPNNNAAVSEPSRTAIAIKYLALHHYHHDRPHKDDGDV